MPSENIEIVSLNVSEKKGTIKRPVKEVELDERGISGDAHAGNWHRQVSLLAVESTDRLAEKAGRPFEPGEFAENITIRGIDLMEISIFDRFRIGDVELEVSQIGKSCHGSRCAIFKETGDCVMPKEGIFCRVLSGGTVRTGDTVAFAPRTLRFRVITLSDRAVRKEYEDLSGPRIRERIEAYFGDTRWRPAVEHDLLPDEPEPLRSALQEARDAAVDVVFTTGGTGIGNRDITPETVTAFCDRIIPGIMDAIRIKYGTNKPQALLSRSVAGAAGATLVFALPGSVRAVDEYMTEILPHIEHMLFMIHGLERHGKHNG